MTLWKIVIALMYKSTLKKSAENNIALCLYRYIHGNDTHCYVQSIEGGHIMCVTDVVFSVEEWLKQICNDCEYLKDIVENYELQSFVLEENIVNLYR